MQAIRLAEHRHPLIKDSFCRAFPDNLYG